MPRKYTNAELAKMLRETPIIQAYYKNGRWPKGAKHSYCGCALVAIAHAIPDFNLRNFVRDERIIANHLETSQ